MASKGFKDPQIFTLFVDRSNTGGMWGRGLSVQFISPLPGLLLTFSSCETARDRLGSICTETSRYSTNTRENCSFKVLLSLSLTCYIENNTWARPDMGFLFQCSTCADSWDIELNTRREIP